MNEQAPDRIRSHQREALASSIVHQAMSLLLDDFDTRLKVQPVMGFKEDGSVQLAEDRKLAQYMSRKIRKKFPTDFIDCEDCINSSTADDDSQWRWIIDPLDGSDNFFRGIKVFASGLALMHRFVPVYAFVSSTLVGTAFIDSDGKARATLPGTAESFLIRVSGTSKLKASAILCSSWGGSKYNNVPVRTFLASQGLSCPDFVSAHTNGLMVAMGKMEGYIHFGSYPCDIAPIHALVKAAGGNATDLDGNPLNYTQPLLKGCIASNGLIHTDLVEAVKEAKYLKL